MKNMDPNNNRREPIAMHRSWTLILAVALAGPSARADSPEAEPAARAWAIADAVLARHVDPPARQQMLLAGLKAVAKGGREAASPGLARRVSDLADAEQLASLLAETWAWWKGADREDREEAFFAGLLSVVPGEARLLSAKERKVEESMQANLYVGIQVALGLDEPSKKPVFLKILEGGPADHAGVKEGDQIEEVDGAATMGMSMTQIIDRLRGEEGTDVLVRYRRPKTGEIFTRPMTRGRLPRVTVEGLTPGPDHKARLDGPLPIGYLKITEVSGSTPRELRTFAGRLETDGIRALVLDLREVTSAHFHATVLLADALLEAGTIGRVARADGEQTYKAEPDALFRGWPLVVLVGKPTPKEIAWLCDSLRATHRATILGDPVVLGEPTISEPVALPGGQWSVLMTTGILLQGNGQPLLSVAATPARRVDSIGQATRKAAEEAMARTAGLLEKAGDPGRNVDEWKRVLEEIKQLSSIPPIKDLSNPALSPKRPIDREKVLARAREILAEALKSAAK